MYISTTTKPLSVLIRLQSSVAETGVEPFVLPAPTPPKPQRAQTPADALALPDTGRSRLSTYSLGMACTITQPPSPIPPSVAPAPPTPGRSRSADSLFARSRGPGLRYKEKWQGGHLQLSHSNLRPEEAPEEKVRSRTP